ncbi:hypothetical protein [Streptomyces wuyuanensis]|uniref:hypothetical protein n=1 Tax=Streptomyces wuyuanensis TaxID=1196353 RepID=UPI0037132853
MDWTSESLPLGMARQARPSSAIAARPGCTLNCEEPLYPVHLAVPRTRIVVTELRAAYWGLKPIFAAHLGAPVEVLLDSLDAFGYLHAWRSGSTRMPEGYDTAYVPKAGCPRS